MALHLKNKRWCVLGFGVSGQWAALLAQAQGAQVTVLDEKSEEHFAAERVAEFKAKGIAFFWGGFSSEILGHADGIIVSPGVPLSSPAIQEVMRTKKIPVVGEIEFASAFVDPGKLIGVTGTDGKSTTTSLIGHFLRKLGMEVFLGGNLGEPLSRFVFENKKVNALVLELSSFQLECIAHFHPHVAVILNLSPDHLDRYETMESYGRAKANIFKNMGPGDVLVLNADHPFTRHFRQWAAPRQCQIDEFSKTGLPLENLDLLPGEHNLENIAAALLVMEAFTGKKQSRDVQFLKSLLQGFKPLPFRLEFVRNIRGVAVYNDSKATTLQATCAALKAFRGNVLWIVGGYQEKSAPELLEFRTEDLQKLKNIILDGRVRAIFVQGENRQEWIESFKASVPLYESRTLEETLKVVRNQMKPGDIVLFSPASKSFDQFKDYKERGEAFKAWVNAWIE